MHGPRCFLQEPPGHVHLCMGAYGEHSSRLRNFEGFKLVTNLKETKEAKCKSKIRYCHNDMRSERITGHDHFTVFDNISFHFGICISIVEVLFHF